MLRRPTRGLPPVLACVVAACGGDGGAGRGASTTTSAAGSALPEDPRLDFSTQTPFTAVLERRAGDPGGAVKLFSAAARSGRRELAIHGRYVLDVTFGDFPYAMRFTPRR